MGPAMFYWMRFAALLWPGRSFKSSISKAITEQFTVDPACICAFLYLMTLFEGKSRQDANHEVTFLLYIFWNKDAWNTINPQLKSKFFDTYKVGAVYWPIAQTINFKFVPVKNQVICTSFFSMLWSVFLAYMKHLEIEQNQLQKGKVVD